MNPNRAENKCKGKKCPDASSQVVGCRYYLEGAAIPQLHQAGKPKYWCPHEWKITAIKSK